MLTPPTFSHAIRQSRSSEYVTAILASDQWVNPVENIGRYYLSRI
jgi:hypothetical protein